MTAHRGLPDPSSFEGTDAEKRAFVADVCRMLHRRTGIFANLPMAALDRMGLQRRLEQIGKTADAPSEEKSA